MRKGIGNMGHQENKGTNITCTQSTKEYLTIK